MSEESQTNTVAYNPKIPNTHVAQFDEILTLKQKITGKIQNPLNASLSTESFNSLINDVLQKIKKWDEEQVTVISLNEKTGIRTGCTDASFSLNKSFTR